MQYVLPQSKAVCFAAIFWGSTIRTNDLKKLNKLIKRTSSIPGTALDPLDLIAKRRMLRKFLNINNNTAHTLHNVLKQWSVISVRLLQLNINPGGPSSQHHDL